MHRVTRGRGGPGEHDVAGASGGQGDGPVVGGDGVKGHRPASTLIESDVTDASAGEAADGGIGG